MKTYALIDPLNMPDFWTMVSTYDPPLSCLYKDPMTDEERMAAPHLIELHMDDLKLWLAHYKAPWGIYLFSESTMAELHKHLRKFTLAMIPGRDVPVTFRFYDPRVIWNVTHIMTDWQLHVFLGPIQSIGTYQQEKFTQDAFMARRRQYPKGGSMGTSYFRLSEEQYDAYTQIEQDRYIQTLSEKMLTQVDETSFSQTLPHDMSDFSIQEHMQQTLLQLAFDLYHFCREQKITDNISIENLANMLIIKHIFSFQMIPKQWLEELYDNEDSGQYRAYMFVERLKRSSLMS